jgi:hypothetical protein
MKLEKHEVGKFQQQLYRTVLICTAALSSPLQWNYCPICGIKQTMPAAETG